MRVTAAAPTTLPRLLACYAQRAAANYESGGAVTYEPRLQRIARRCASLSPLQNELKAAKFVRWRKKKQWPQTLWGFSPSVNSANKQTAETTPATSTISPAGFSPLIPSSLPIQVVFSTGPVRRVNPSPAPPESGRRRGPGAARSLPRRRHNKTRLAPKKRLREVKSPHAPTSSTGSCLRSDTPRRHN